MPIPTAENCIAAPFPIRELIAKARYAASTLDQYRRSPSGVNSVAAIYAADFLRLAAEVLEVRLKAQNPDKALDWRVHVARIICDGTAETLTYSDRPGTLVRPDGTIEAVTGPPNNPA